MAEEEQDQPSAVVAMASMAAILSGPDKLLEKVLEVAKGILTTWAIPVEMWVRPGFGSEYYNPIQVICSLMITQCVFGLSVLLRVGAHMIPEKWRPGSCLIGMGVVLVLYYVTLAYHGWRVSKLMKNMDLEFDSQEDGDTIRAMQALPKGTNWVRARVWYEPSLIIVLSLTLWAVRLMDIYATLFLVFCAVSLWCKAALLTYEAWHYVRGKRNADARGKKLRGIFKGHQAPQTMAGRVLPVVTSPEEMAYVAARMTGMESEYAHLVTKPAEVNGHA